jgi:hypothetical protein
MNPKIPRQFGMKRARPASSLSDQYRLSIDARQDFDGRSQPTQSGRPDEDAFHPRPLCTSRAGRKLVLVRNIHGRDERIELCAIRVSLGFEVEQTQGWHGMVPRGSRHDDRPGASSEDCATPLRELLDRLHELEASEPLRDRRTLAPRQNQRREVFEITRGQHASPSSAKALEGGQMLLDVTLDAEYTDDGSLLTHA